MTEAGRALLEEVYQALRHLERGVKEAQLRALANDPFVMYARRQKPSTSDLVITLCSEAGFSPIIVQEAATEQAVIGLVAAGVGVSLAAGSLRDVHVL